jgi:hypothetical protein
LAAGAGAAGAGAAIALGVSPRGQSLQHHPHLGLAVLRQFGAGLHRPDQVGQHVAGAQEHLHPIGRHRDLVRTHLVEQGFEHVGIVDETLQPEGAGAALDRMQGAERRMQRVLVARAFVERHQVALHLAQQLLALLEVELFQFGQIVHDILPLFPY